MWLRRRSGSSSLSLLRSRGFLLLWLGQFLGILADWSVRTALLIWVYALTRSGTLVSVVGVAEALPLLVLAPVAGVFVDRWSRSATMAGAVIARAVLLLPLLLVTSRAGLPLILAVTLLVNAASQFFLPAASAAVPVVAGQDRVGEANSMLSLANGGVAVVAPGAAALLFAVIGPHGTFLALSCLYVATVPLLLAIPAPRPTRAAVETASILREIQDGVRYVARSRLLLSLTAVAFVAMLGIGALSVLDVVFVTRALHLRPAAVGPLLSSSGVGELLGGLAATLLGARLARRYHLVLGLATVLAGLGIVGYALTRSLPEAIAVLFVVGFSFPAIIVSFMTMAQLVTEDAFMGRVMSTTSTAMAVATIASMAFGGALTDLFGVRQVIAGAAALLILAGLLSLALIRQTPLTGVAREAVRASPPTEDEGQEVYNAPVA